MKVVSVPVKQINTDDCIRKGFGDLLSLMISIRNLGLLHPIGITSNFRLVYGKRRLEACKRLKWDSIPAVVIRDDKLAFRTQREENVMRRELTAQEMVELTDRITGTSASNPADSNTESGSGDQDCPNLDKPNATTKKHSVQRKDDIAAKQVGLGCKSTYRYAQAVVDKGCDQLKDAMNQKKVSISAAAQLAKLPKKEQEKLDYDNPKALKQKAKVLRMKKPAEDNDPVYAPEVLKVAELVDPWLDEWVYQLMELLDKRIRHKGLTVIDGDKK